MHLKFYKYQGAGNDFVIINNLKRVVELNSSQIAKLCDRKFGIGADGLMLLEKSNNYDFEMKYFNSDGNVGSMCGNGGRCIVKFAQDIDLIDQHAIFLAFDGVHEAIIDENGLVELEMCDVGNVSKLNDNSCVLNTGSPHYVKFIEDVNAIDVVEEGRKIRNSESFVKEGINVNFVSVMNNELQIRTYERGVEDETLSCGTGVTASVIASVFLGLVKFEGLPITVYSKGGILKVCFVQSENSFNNIVLIGPAIKTFEGEITLC